MEYVAEEAADDKGRVGELCRRRRYENIGRLRPLLTQVEGMRLHYKVPVLWESQVGDRLEKFIWHGECFGTISPGIGRYHQGLEISET